MIPIDNFPLEVLLRVGQFLPGRLGLPLNHKFRALLGSPMEIARRAFSHYGAEDVLIAEVRRRGADPDVIRALLRKYACVRATIDIISQHPPRETALIAAARVGNALVCEALLDAGANAAIEADPCQFTNHWPHHYPFFTPPSHIIFSPPRPAIYYAVRRGHIDVVDIMIKKGRLSREKLDDALSSAMQENIPHIAKLLLDWGATVDMNAYQRMVVLGHIEMVELLIQSGVEVPVGDSVEPLTHAAKLGDWYLVDILLNAGANPNANNGLPLLEAVKGRHVDIVENLLDRGADVHAQGDQALIHSAERSYLDVMTLLLNRGADVHAQGGLALLCAVEAGARVHHNARHVGTCRDLPILPDSFKIVELLLQRGVNPSVTDSLGRTPLDFANATLIPLLLQYIFSKPSPIL